MPENTSRKLADLLVNLTPAQQVAALCKLPEIQDTFERFGSTTVLQALQQQLRNMVSHSERLDPAKVVKSKAYSSVNLANIDRSWTLEDSGPRDGFEHDLPALTVVDNVVFVNGQYCERALIKPSLVAWSREVTTNVYEHGFCKFVRPLYYGSGGLFYSDILDAHDVPETGLRKFNAVIAPTLVTATAMNGEAVARDEADEGLQSEAINNASVNGIMAMDKSVTVSTTEESKPLPEGSIVPKEYQGTEHIFLRYVAPWAWCATVYIVDYMAVTIQWSGRHRMAMPLISR